ncbi:MAG: hypothetical protein QM784_09975 [Polyangiaceae bacterium]
MRKLNGSRFSLRATLNSATARAWAVEIRLRSSWSSRSHARELEPASVLSDRDGSSPPPPDVRGVSTDPTAGAVLGRADVCRCGVLTVLATVDGSGRTPLPDRSLHAGAPSRAIAQPNAEMMAGPGATADLGRLNGWPLRIARSIAIEEGP